MSERVPSSADVYGSPEHAAREVLAASIYTYEGYVSGAEVADLAQLVVDGLRERGFVVTNEPRCECGWTGIANHLHDTRMGRAPSPDTPNGAPPAASLDSV